MSAARQLGMDSFKVEGKERWSKKLVLSFLVLVTHFVYSFSFASY
jgi:hypothetical protein